MYIGYLDFKYGDELSHAARAIRIREGRRGHHSPGICTGIEELEGSWYFQFRYQPSPEHLLVDKGSICINGVSLTVVSPKDDQFSVAIIPYTYEHTNFHQLEIGSKVNLEFDILGKYLARYAALYAGRVIQEKHSA